VEDAFRISAAQQITLQIDLELLKEIKEKTEKDEELMDILKKLRNGERRDSQVALGLCEEQDGMVTYEGLIWIPQDDEL
jgi:hypothetical protein